jgi:hypothetical protein
MDERWRRLINIISAFAPRAITPFVLSWERTANPYCVPVGLGVVVSDDHVKAIRAYLGVENPTLESIEILAGISRGGGNPILARVHDGFTSRFGSMRRQGITVGFDFVPGAPSVHRVKVDFCCHLIAPDVAPLLLPWIDEMLEGLSFKAAGFHDFLNDIHSFWRGNIVQFVSLGFAPRLEHATIYVQPFT